MPLMTAPQMFTIGGNFYTFDFASGEVCQRHRQRCKPIRSIRTSSRINGKIYIINTNVLPNAVVGGGNTYPMTAGNTQFSINDVQYTIALKQNSLNGATVSGQFDITQGNVVVIENYVYQLDTLNGQIVGNGTAYPLTTPASPTRSRLRTQLHRHHCTQRQHGHDRQRRLLDQQHHRRRRRRHLSDPRLSNVL